MPRFAAVSRERHGNKKWQRFTNYGFAAADAMVPIVGAEVGRAALAMPCAFMHEQEAGRYTLVVALSPIPGRNMFVGPDGSWLGPYVPFWFRVYPFRLLPAPGLDQPVLCVDEDSTLIVDRIAAGEEFFDAAGNLSPALKPVFEALMHVERNRKVTDLAVAALAQADVIQPWPIKLKTDQGEQAVGGFNSYAFDAADAIVPIWESGTDDAVCVYAPARSRTLHTGGGFVAHPRSQYVCRA